MGKLKRATRLIGALVLGITSVSPTLPAHAADLASAEPAVYTSYTFADTLANDKAEGGITFYSGMTLEACEPSADTQNLAWISRDGTGDFAVMRTEKDSKPCVFTTTFCRPQRKDRPVTDGFVCFETGSKITTANKNLSFDIDYFDDIEGDLSLLYVNGSTTGNFGRANTVKTGSGEWKTFSTSVSNAHFNGSTTTGLVDGKCDFRIETKPSSTYVSRVAVYNITKDGFDELTAAADAIALPFDAETAVSEDFALPTVGENGTEIVWESNSSAVKINGGNAQITQSNSEQTVVLDAYAVKNDRYIKRSFDITVAPEAYKPRALTFSGETWGAADGKKTVSISAENADLSSGVCMLLLVSRDKATGELRAVSTASEPLGEKDSFTLTAEAELSDTLDYSCYIWDGNGISLKNAPPASVIPTVATKNRALEISWDAAADDYDAVGSYTILIDGKQAAQVPASSDKSAAYTYKFKGAAEATPYSIAVTATDSAGLTSVPVPVTAELAKMATIDLADCENSSGGISFSLNETASGGDNYSIPAEYDGIAGRQNVNRKPINGLWLSYLYFSVDKNIISSNDRRVTLEITYFDKGTGSVLLQYNATGGNIAKQITAATLTDTNTWKTASVSLTDAEFTSPAALTFSDFRITGSGSTDGEICVSRVSAICTEKY